MNDSHVHTGFSFDCDYEAEVMARSAIEKGAEYVAFTEHADLVSILAGDYEPLRHDDAAREVMRLRKLFDGKLQIALALELGEPFQAEKECRELLAAHPYDFIINSYHSMINTPDFYYLNYDGVDLDALFDRYLDELAVNVTWDDYDIMGHLTYPVRYFIKNGYDFDIQKHTEKIRAVFRNVIDGGHGIEINTSGLRSGMGMTMPDLDSLKLYHDMGGEIITIGSDAHFPEHICADFNTGYELLREAGFKYTARFWQRKAEMFPL